MNDPEIVTKGSVAVGGVVTDGNSPGNSVTVLTKLDKLPSVDLIITGTEGDVLATFHFGVNPHLAGWLSRANQMDDKECPVKKNTESLMILGQDSFVVSREFTALLRGLAYPIRSLSEIRQLEKNMPETATYTFVVSH